MNAKERYQKWVEKLDKNSPFYKKLLEIKDDAEEIEERFYQELAFGTAGLRGKLKAGTNCMNFAVVGRATQGLANYILKQGPEAAKKGVIIAHDPRHYSKEFSQMAAGILAANGIKAYVFPDLRPTPELAFLVRELGTISGINITASHNPRDYEGVEKGLIVVLGPEYDRAYLDKIESLAIHSGDELDLSIPLVYTPLNGAGSIPFRQMLTDRGFTNWYIVEEQENPDPDFTTVGYPNPESPAAFKMSEELGRKVGAELLMATDPDSDRFAIEIRDDKGDYIPLNGNQTGYILVNYILEGRKTAGTLPTNGAMVKSIVTSTLTTDIAESYGVKMYEALTGFKNICGRIPFLHENDLVYLFGYEESVGYAASEDIRDKDGISAGMLVAEAAAYYRLQGKTLWDVLNDIYEKYGYAAEDEPNLILEGIAGSQRISRMMDSLREEPITEAAGYKVVKTIDYINGYEDIPASNVLRYFLDNGSWFAIRPSGTEPKIKFYFYTIGNSREEALEVNNKIKEDVLARVNRVE